MRKLNLLIILIPFIFINQTGNNFLNQQMQYQHFRKASEQKYEIVRSYFKEKNLEFPPHEIFLRVFKKQRIVELWARVCIVDTFTLVKSYPFCSGSGMLGPKRRQGDLQIPEGFYYIDRFNPYSNFYLSLGINYPNASDKILGVKGKLGGDIFIHGSCVTIGCIPITDNLIKELYLIAVYTKNGGQNRIPVHIFPTHLNDITLQKLEKQYTKNKVDFWKNLKAGYLYFQNTHKIPKTSVDSTTGEYFLDEE